MGTMSLTNRASSWKPLFLITLVLFSTSCMNASIFRKWQRERDERALVERAVAEFHTLLNQEKYEDIYNLLEDEKRKPQNKDSFVAAMQGVHEKWGEVQGVRVNSMSFPSANSSVIMFCDTKFEKGDGREMFIWQVNDKEVRLSDYLVAR